MIDYSTLFLGCAFSFVLGLHVSKAVFGKALHRHYRRAGIIAGIEVMKEIGKAEGFKIEMLDAEKLFKKGDGQ